MKEDEALSLCLSLQYTLETSAPKGEGEALVEYLQRIQQVLPSESH